MLHGNYYADQLGDGITREMLKEGLPVAGMGILRGNKRDQGVSPVQSGLVAHSGLKNLSGPNL